MKGLDSGIPKADDRSKQICQANREAGPGGCVVPCPPVSSRIIGVWSAFELAKSLALERVGVDGVVVGVDVVKARACFDAVGEPWVKANLELFELLASGFADKLARERK
jgi:hypothetical protein